MSSSEDYKSLSHDEKLQLIDKELADLHQYYVNKGFDQYTIERCAKPLLDMANEAQKKILKRLIVTGIIVATLLTIVFVLPQLTFVSVACRLAFIKMIPIYDWTPMMNWDCLINNPYYVETPFTEEDCKICIGMKEIGSFKTSELSPEAISEDYLRKNVPFILTDAMKEWSAKDKFTAKFLLELYTTNNVLKDAEVCMFKNNLKVKKQTPQYVLDRIIRAKVSGYFMHWENCDAQAAKELRTFYHRPEVFPPMVAMATSNWVFIAGNYKKDLKKYIDIALPLMMYAQVKGEARISIMPRSPCNETCQVYSTILHPGELVVVTSLMWDLFYTPQDNEETIAIATGGDFSY